VIGTAPARPPLQYKDGRPWRPPPQRRGTPPRFPYAVERFTGSDLPAPVCRFAGACVSSTGALALHTSVPPRVAAACGVGGRVRRFRRFPPPGATVYAGEDVFGGEVVRFHMPHFLRDVLPAVVALSTVRGGGRAVTRECWRSAAAGGGGGTWGPCAGVPRLDATAAVGSVVVAPQLRSLGPISWVASFLGLIHARALSADDVFPGVAGVSTGAPARPGRSTRGRVGGATGGRGAAGRLACFRSLTRTRLPNPATPTAPILPTALMSTLELFTGNNITKAPLPPQWPRACGRGGGGWAVNGTDGGDVDAAGVVHGGDCGDQGAAGAVEAVHATGEPSPPPTPAANATCTLRVTLLNRLAGYPRHIPHSAALQAALRDASTPRLRLKVSTATFEGTPLKHQIGVMQRTDVLVAAHGAGITNALFLRAGSSLVEVSPFGYAASVFRWLAVSVTSVRYERVVAAPDSDVFVGCMRRRHPDGGEWQSQREEAVRQFVHAAKMYRAVRRAPRKTVLGTRQTADGDWRQLRERRAAAEAQVKLADDRQVGFAGRVCARAQQMVVDVAEVVAIVRDVAERQCRGVQ